MCQIQLTLNVEFLARIIVYFILPHCRVKAELVTVL